MNENYIEKFEELFLKKRIILLIFIILIIDLMKWIIFMKIITIYYILNLD